MMGKLRKLWDRLNGDRDDRDDFANRMDAARARGAARRPLFDPLPALNHERAGFGLVGALNTMHDIEKQKVSRLETENAHLTQRVKDLEEENAFFRAFF